MHMLSSIFSEGQVASKKRRGRREGSVMGWLYTAEGASVIWAHEFRLLPDSTKFMMTSDYGGSEGKEQ